jgi:hypothetical protein
MTGIGHNGAPMSEGWIARHRAVRDHWLVGHGLLVKPADPARKRTSTQGEAWEDLCMECRYSDGAVMNGGRKMELRRGELLGAVSWLAARWNWTPKTVRRFLDQLEGDGMIELKSPGVQNGTQKGKQATVINVCNYDLYRTMRAHEGQAKGHATGEQRASTGQAEGTQGASKGQAEGNIYKEEQGNKGTKEQEIIPPAQPWAKRERTAEEIAEADRIAVEVLEMGDAIKGGLVAKSARATVRGKGELDGSKGILIDHTGKLNFVNCVGSDLLSILMGEFPGVNIEAACNRAGGDLAKLSYPTVQDAMGVIRRHAQFIVDDTAKNKPRSPRSAAPSMTIENDFEKASRFVEEFQAAKKPKQGRLIP